MDDEAAAVADWDQKSKRSANNETGPQGSSLVLFQKTTPKSFWELSLIMIDYDWFKIDLSSCSPPKIWHVQVGHLKWKSFPRHADVSQLGWEQMSSHHGNIQNGNIMMAMDITW